MLTNYVHGQHIKLAFVANKNTLWVSGTCNGSRRLGSLVGLDVVVETVLCDNRNACSNTKSQHARGCRQAASASFPLWRNDFIKMELKNRPRAFRLPEVLDYPGSVLVETKPLK